MEMHERTAPACVGIILDGNRRWATARGVPTVDGHKAGMEALKKIVVHCTTRQIRHLAAYVFSSENWQRSSAEVQALMELMARGIVQETPFLLKHGIRVRIVGERERFTPDIRQAIGRVEAETAACDALTVWLCLSYGSRAEIIAAVQGARSEDVLTEVSFARHLWSAGMPDPDLIIRTGGRKRLSNFLLWQAAYSELFFLDTLWPDFNEAAFDTVLSEFAERTRTFGI